MGKPAEFRFDPGPLDVATIERDSTATWSDLAFDLVALAALKRDGALLDGVRLTGPFPYTVSADGDGVIVITVGDRPDADALIVLWQLHFLKTLRHASLAA